MVHQNLSRQARQLHLLHDFDLLYFHGREIKANSQDTGIRQSNLGLMTYFQLQETPKKHGKDKKHRHRRDSEGKKVCQRHMVVNIYLQKDESMMIINSVKMSLLFFCCGCCCLFCSFVCLLFLQPQTLITRISNFTRTNLTHC